MSDRTFRTSAGQTIVVPSDEPDTLQHLSDYLRDNGLSAEEITPQQSQQAGSNPMNQIIGMGANVALERGADSLMGGILGGGGSSAATGATGFNLAGEVPAGLTYEGGFTGMSGGAAPTELGLGARGGLGAAGFMGLRDITMHDRGALRSPLQGAASGAAVGTAIAPGIGTVIGAGVGGLYGLGQGLFGQKSKTKKEQEDRKKLAAAGIKVDNADVKEWELNDKFKGSRNESELGGNDIKNAASLYLRYGKDFSNLTNSQRAAIGQLALDRKLVREHKGRIDISYDDEFDKAARALMVAKPAGRSNNGGTRKANPGREAPIQSAPEPQVPGKVIPGPAVTVDAGGPSPYQPDLITPQDYAAKYRQMLAQRGYQGLQ